MTRPRFLAAALATSIPLVGCGPSTPPVPTISFQDAVKDHEKNPANFVRCGGADFPASALNPPPVTAAPPANSNVTGDNGRPRIVITPRTLFETVKTESTKPNTCYLVGRDGKNIAHILNSAGPSQ